MFTVVKDDILNATTDVVVHQVNCMGVMGAGLAKQIAEEHPQHFADYIEHLDFINRNGLNALGSVVYTETSTFMIAGVFGQRSIGGKATIYAALQYGLHDVINEFGCTGTIAIPYGLGCGLGGGDWKVVYDMLVSLKEMYPEIEFVIYSRGF